MRSKFNCLVVAAFCFFLVLPASAWSRSIEVKGTGFSREEAVRNGLRNAVEHVVGVYLVSKSQVENFVLEDDTITTESAGFVKSYRILSCGKEDGLEKCHLVVDVEGDENEIASFLRRLLGEKTFSIQVVQYAGGMQLEDRSLAQGLARKLIKSGYYVVRESFGPFYRITGSATATEARSRLTDLKVKVVALANMEIVLTDRNNMQIATLTHRDVERCMGTGNTLNEATLDFFKSLSGDLGKKFVKAIKDRI